MFSKPGRLGLLASSASVVVLIAVCWYSLNTKPSVSSAIMGAQGPPPGDSARIKSDYGKLPLNFEANQGQTHSHVKFLARGSGYSLFLTPNEAVLGLRSKPKAESMSDSADQTAVLRMKLEGANTKAIITGQEELPGKINYFIGNDPRRWRTDVSTYAKVKYEAVYPGVDLIYYGKQGRQLEYDFVVAPGADPRAIRLSFTGAEKLELDAQGDLLLTSLGQQMRMHKPVVYQEKSGQREEIADGYTLNEKQQVSFDIATYDTTRPLVIDPVLTYSTFLGGTGEDTGIEIAVSAHGNAFVTGLTTSPNFPTEPTNAAFGPGGGSDAFVTKFNAEGNQLIYSTYLGGSSNENFYDDLDLMTFGRRNPSYLSESLSRTSLRRNRSWCRVRSHSATRPPNVSMITIPLPRWIALK